jgi:protein-L-isoaspartate(D-aspartate) O-methyltransferase
MVKSRWQCLGIALAAVWIAAPLAAAEDDFTRARRRMMEEVSAMAAVTARETGRPTLDPRVIAAMEKVPRHLYVPADMQRNAYENRPLPIGHGQTISQPYIVALMTDLLRVKPGDVVFELGTGSGYQAAVLAELVNQVYTIEIIPPLAKQADERLVKLGYRNIRVKIADGYYGWEERAPFDAIIVTASAGHIPPSLVKQLKRGGRMVIPVGAPFMVQDLMLVEKQADGSITSRSILPVSFVPVTGRH